MVAAMTLSRSLLPLNALRAFEAAARHESFTRAAAELHVTQAAVSHQVKMLEERVGTVLFHRLPHGLRLTEEGHRLLPRLRDAFDRIETALEDLSAGSGGPRGALSISLVATFGMSWLVPRLPRFHARFPHIDLRLTTHNNDPVDFDRDPVDLAIRYGDGDWPSVAAERLFDYRLTPLCGPRLAARLATPGDLRGAPLLRTNNEDWLIWLAAAGLPPLPFAGPLFDSTRMMVEAAIEGMGVALASPDLFACEIADGRLRQPFPLCVPSGRAYWLIRPEGREPGPRAWAFRDWIVGEATAGAAKLEAGNL
jgi:LysR family transcriptional regulator, regulator of gene expression of beta-lactamase